MNQMNYGINGGYDIYEKKNFGQFTKRKKADR